MARLKLAPLCAAVAITASGVILIASPAQAKEKPVVVQAPFNDEVPVRRVTYADLDLTKKAGEKMLHRRVGRAVLEVCDDFNPGADRFQLIDCRGFAWDGARPQIARAVGLARGTAVADGSGSASSAIVINLRQ